MYSLLKSIEHFPKHNIELFTGLNIDDMELQNLMTSVWDSKNHTALEAIFVFLVKTSNWYIL